VDISVIGAGGAIGREIVAQIVTSRLLRPTERLQLVGSASGSSSRTLYGLRSDLTDAYVETAPQMDIALRPEEIVADVIVMASSVSPKSPETSRDELAAGNRRLFREVADALARYGHGHEIVLVVTNPVELGVTMLAQELGWQRVVGIGAYSDSLRFRREVANDLGTPRQLVSGYVVGEHGTHLVPLWSSVRIHGQSEAESASSVWHVRGGFGLDGFWQRVREAQESIAHLLTTETRSAFEEVERMPADIRVLLRPVLTHLSGSKTVMATANVTVDVLRQIIEGREMSVAGQTLLETDAFYGVRGAFGVPLLLSNQGIVRVISPPLWDEEIVAVHRAADAIQRKVSGWLEAS
jgi:malate dehydrogenase